MTFLNISCTAKPTLPEDSSVKASLDSLKIQIAQSSADIWDFPDDLFELVLRLLITDRNTC